MVQRGYAKVSCEGSKKPCRPHVSATGATTEAESARKLLDRNGTIEVYQQRPLATATGAGKIDLEGDLSRVCDNELDANGLTTH